MTPCGQASHYQCLGEGENRFRWYQTTPCNISEDQILSAMKISWKEHFSVSIPQWHVLTMMKSMEKYNESALITTTTNNGLVQPKICQSTCTLKFAWKVESVCKNRTKSWKDHSWLEKTQLDPCGGVLEYIHHSLVSCKRKKNNLNPVLGV
jgi:hypothetical protein